MSLIEGLRAGRRTSLAIGLSVGLGVAVPSVVVLAGFALGALDPLRHIDTPTTAAAAARKAQTGATAGRLPALTDLTAALTDGPTGWAGQGAITTGASLPAAVTCVPSPITPVVTVSRGFAVNGAQVTVTLAAYVAGAGGSVFDTQSAGIPSCTVPGGSSSVAAGAADGPGTARFSVSTAQAGVLTSTQVWRRGDVIAYLGGSDPTTEAALAVPMDQTLFHALGSDCVDQDSLATDDVRDPFAVTKRTAFKGLTVDQGINQTPTPLPSPTTLTALVQVPVAGSSPSGSAAPETVSSPVSVPVSQGPLGVALPAPVVAVTPSKPPWPVYPPLPTGTPAPVPPSVPASEPPTHAPLRESQVDTAGPGCGWAFTGMLAPTPPVVLSAAALSAKQAALQPLLAREQAAWQESVNAYWLAYTSYLGQVQAYAAYTDVVNQVSAAWSVIDGQWATYQALKASYDQMIADRKKFLSDQQAAAAAYAANQASCTPTAAPGAPGAPAAPAAPAAPNDVAAPHARAADTPSPSASASATGGGGLFPTLGPTSAAPSATPTTAAPTVAATDSAAPPTDVPPATATTAPAAVGPAGTPCEAPPLILSQTPPAAPTGPPPTKPADPRPGRSAASPSPTNS